MAGILIIHKMNRLEEYGLNEINQCHQADIDKVNGTETISYQERTCSCGSALEAA